ncbi:DNA mismatch repair endonuclease MutL [Candidatus Woesearchaeota archaeon]|nr:DNA mismatch repair endonuclease MutL [Candidatus Woesearchaeota archaeon]
MNDIIILDESLINKIAAGEVIERPKSIVKELIENSIDAGADNIFIEIKEGGKSYIKVQDNGFGMNENNAKKACLRHSTSKISKTDDLFNISTLGFRGEALASMAAVSELILTTKQQNNPHGIKLTYKAGRLISEEKTGCPKGTTVEINNLFYNTPARKKYMRPMQIELNHIIDIVQRYALIHPEIHFKLVHNNKELLNSPSTSNTQANLSYIYGRNIAKDMLPVNFSSGLIEIMGFISKPNLNKSTKSDQSIYINRRYIKNKTISDALNNAYHTLMFINRYPVAVLNISIDPSKIDVNVHPAKSEVKLEREKEIYDVVFEAVRQTLLENDLIPDMRLRTPAEYPKLKVKEPSSAYALQKHKQKTLSETSDISLKKLPEMVIHGIVNKTYILGETKDELIIIDQHAAAERILYEKFMEQFYNKKIQVQKLLNPLLIELDPKKHLILESNLEFLKEIGFELEPFGKNEFIISTLPSVLGKQVNKEMILDIISELDSAEKTKTIDELKNERIARMACRSAVKAGEELTMHQIRDYLQSLDKKEISYTCPHGRPILIKFTFRELEKMFKRT